MKKNYIQISREKVLVPVDKFDTHMRCARLNDIKSRKAIFCTQLDDGEERRHLRTKINSSVY